LIKRFLVLRPVLGRILAKIGPKTVDKTGPEAPFYQQCRSYLKTES